MSFKPSITHQGKTYFYDHEQGKWFTDDGKEVPENIAMKLRGKFTDMRKGI